jgi:Na+-transporting methylmalonyl-CoA/oxaloacetate decarboxylase gamma subunit
MNADIFDILLNHPLGQLAMTVVVAVVTSLATVRIMMARVARTPAPPAPAAELAPDEDEALIAAIAAAVYATIGAHRIVYIGPSSGSTASSWTAAMRTRHHASHAVTQRRPTNE